jgi:polar amino acid transport system substrate-binding protein
MKKGLFRSLVSVAIVSTMGITLMSCGAKKEEDKFDTVKAKGKVVVGLSADYAPYEFHAMIDGNDTVSGFDVQIANEIAKDMGVEVEIKEMSFDSLIAALQADQIDMIISGMNPDETRKQQIDFSDIYYEAQHAVIVRKDQKDNYNNAEDLNGKIVGAQLGSTQQKIAQEKIKAQKLQLLSDVNNLILELKTNKIDAIITEEPVAAMATQTNSDITLSQIKFPSEGGGNAVGISKGSPKFVESINSTIKRLKESKALEKFYIDANNLAGQNVSK